MNDVPKLRELILSAKFARCRSRFVVPVILYENKVGVCGGGGEGRGGEGRGGEGLLYLVLCMQNVCRSSTLSSMAELYGRSGFDWILALPTVGECYWRTPPTNSEKD